MRFLCCSLALISTTVCFTSVSAAEPPAGFQTLFNGVNLDGLHGWDHEAMTKYRDAAPDEFRKVTAEWTADAEKHWSVENGELVNDGHGKYLATDGNYRDFELLLEYKTVAGADSGIYLKGCPQVQIWDFTDPRKFAIGADLGSGGLWNNSPGRPGKDPLFLADRPMGEWNSFRVIQVGCRTSVWLNGQHVVDNVIMENYFDRGSPLPVDGPVVLQTHGGEIRWRHMAIRKLSSNEANTFLATHQGQAFTSIFNGKDLSGWQGAVDDYEVVNGAIRCRDGHGGLLLTENEYSNFIARLEFRLPPGGNNGLAIRSPLQGDPAYHAMCELQVLDSTHEKYANLDDRQYHGSAYGMTAARRGYLRPTGEWNYQQVVVDGSRIQVELNGAVIVDTDLAAVTEYMKDSPHPGKDRTSGYFGFAGHSDPVEFRNVAIRKMADSQ
ncbi:MAG: DUF1080 domain-containing protein [Fuerstiella sp.]|nr:DUF1080 domain-containing protein [Fuerstiella sp.]